MRGVPGCVVDEVAHELAQQAGVALHPRGRDPARVDRRAGRRRARAGLVEQQVVEVDVAALEAQGALVGVREHEHALHESLEPPALVEHGLAELVVADALGVGACDLGVLPQRGERRPQLVRGIRDEPSLRRLRGLEAVEHAVQRARQPADLVVDRRLVDAPGERARGDAVDLPSHALDRARAPGRR